MKFDSKSLLFEIISPILILMFSDFTWRRIGREKFPLSLNIIAQTLELELDLGLLLVIVLTVLSNAQARSRKSTFVKNYNRIHSSQLSRKLGFVGEFNLVL